MALDPLVSEYADFCPVCTEMALLCWSDSDLDERICDDCAEYLIKAGQTLLKLNLDPPSNELINAIRKWITTGLFSVSTSRPGRAQAKPTCVPANCGKSN